MKQKFSSGDFFSSSISLSLFLFRIKSCGITNLKLVALSVTKTKAKVLLELCDRVSAHPPRENIVSKDTPEGPSHPHPPPYPVILRGVYRLVRAEFNCFIIRSLSKFSSFSSYDTLQTCIRKKKKIIQKEKRKRERVTQQTFIHLLIIVKNWLQIKIFFLLTWNCFLRFGIIERQGKCFI